MENNPLICPVCSRPLEWSGRDCRCAAGHCFDPAKEGYLNLLLAHQRRSAQPGDDAGMVAARRRFFDAGIYDPLVQHIRTTAARLPHSTLLDCGCGEGALAGPLSELDGCTVYGADISKEAVRYAAKRYKKGRWLVTNGMKKLPFADASVDLILSVLAPRNPPEFARILQPGGTLLLGVPGPGHLIELRSRLSGNSPGFEEKADEAAEKCRPFFEETGRDLLNRQVVLKREQIGDLIRMTPIFWCSTPERKAAATELDELALTLSFALLELRPCAQPPPCSAA